MATSPQKKSEDIDAHETADLYYAGQTSAHLMALKDKQYEANTNKKHLSLTQIAIIISAGAVLLATFISCLITGIAGTILGWILTR